MSETPPQSSAGTGLPTDALPLPEAVQRFVPNDLWEAYSAAAKDRARFPGRAIRYSSYVSGEETAPRNRTANQARAANIAKGKAWTAIKQAFAAMLIEGALIAHVRREFPFGDWDTLPPDAWTTLRITDWRRGVVEGTGVKLADIRISATPVGHREPPHERRHDGPAAKLPVLEPSASQAVGSTLPRNLLLTIDPRCSKIIIRDMGELTGANYRLVAVLAEKALKDFEAHKAPEDHQCVKAPKLADRLGVNEYTVRRRVSECRKAFAAMAAASFGVDVPLGLLIENARWQGYRLNPYIRIVAPSE